MTYASIGLSRDVLKNKGTLTLTLNDVFNSRKRRYTTEGENFFSQGEFQWRSRQFTVALNYRLNQKKRRDRSGNRGGDGFEGGDGEF